MYIYHIIFSSINNGLLAKKNKIILRNNKKTIKILNLLIKEGFIRNFEISSNEINIFVYLKYFNNKPVFNKIKQISKPSKKIYISNNNLYKKNYKGLLILSTSIGCITNLEAQKKNLGGEIICQII